MPGSQAQTWYTGMHGKGRGIVIQGRFWGKGIEREGPQGKGGGSKCSKAAVTGSGEPQHIQILNKT